MILMMLLLLMMMMMVIMVMLINVATSMFCNLECGFCTASKYIVYYSIHEFYCQQIHQLDQQISWEAPNWWKKMTAKLRGCPLI
jgi:hypothetical protein